MSNDTTAFRSLIIYAICLPVAIILGWLICDPLDRTTDITFGIVLFLLVLPLLLRWYHVWLIALWNSAVVFYFLPGTLSGVALMSFLGFMVAVGHYILHRDRKFVSAPSVACSLIFLALVVLVTAKLRGGIGLRVLGDEAIGGKRYIAIWLAILGYFALTSQAIPPHKRQLYAVLFLIGGITALIGEAAGVLGGPFHFVYLFFPLGSGSNATDAGSDAIVRWGGLANAMMALTFTLVARYGIAGLVNLRKLWRPLLFFSALFLSTFGGSRSVLILIVMTLGMVFCLEGLLRSHLMPAAILGLLLAGSLLLAFSDRMPLTLQRSIAFLPVKLNPTARMSADSTSDWRLEIWESVLPQVPKYLWLGKGLSMDKNDWAEYVQFGESQVGGEVGGGTAVSGDYHSGPLTLIIPFGIWGCIGFLWFLAAALKVLWANYKYGDADLRRINTFLLSFFIGKMVLFFFVFGGFYADIMIFAGVVGFSESLNGGVAKKAVQAANAAVVVKPFRSFPTDKPVVAGRF